MTTLGLWFSLDPWRHCSRKDLPLTIICLTPFLAPLSCLQRFCTTQERQTESARSFCLPNWRTSVAAGRWSHRPWQLSLDTITAAMASVKVYGLVILQSTFAVCTLVFVGRKENPSVFVSLLANHVRRYYKVSSIRFIHTSSN